MVLPGKQHATRILTHHPEMAEIIAVWFKQKLEAEDSKASLTAVNKEKILPKQSSPCAQNGFYQKLNAAFNVWGGGLAGR